MGEAYQTSSLATRVADRVRAIISERSLKPGDRVATEGQLAAEMSISRVAVREGIGQLRGLGLVEPSKRNGIVVAQSDPTEILGMVIPQYVVDHATFCELTELRCLMEIASVQVGVRRATEGDIARLRELAEESVALLSTTAKLSERGFEVEAEFHKAILSASHSPLLEGMHRVIVQFFRRAPQEMAVWYPGEIPAAQEHAQIAEAFAERDVERARQLLTAHLLPYLVPPTEKGKTVQDGKKGKGIHHG